MNDPLQILFYYKCFFVFLGLFTLCAFIVFFCFYFKQKREPQFKKKDKRKLIWKCKTESHTASIWIKEARNKSGMTKKSCRACWIRLGQIYIIFYRRRNVLYRVWLNSKTLTHFNGSTSPTPKFYEPTLPTPPKLFSRLNKCISVTVTD